MNSLGILVTSAARIDWVFKLAEAAVTREKNVWVHFCEQGVLGLCDREIDTLTTCAKVSICTSSVERFGLNRLLFRRCGPFFAPPSAVAELVRTCERYVVL